MKKNIVFLSLALFPFLLSGREAVDMGLSVKWADCNVGAALPGESGSLFAWGATVTAPYFDWAYYPLCEGYYNALTKYNSDPELGKTDGLTVLRPEDDAATAQWGDGWRIPTDAEWKELMKNCDWKMGKRDGESGYVVTSPKTGNSIFLPFAAAKSGGEIRAGMGRYWSSTLSDSSGWCALSAAIYKERIERPLTGRYLGCAVRPVKK